MKPIGNRYLMKKTLKKVIQEAISRLDSPENADRLEFEIRRAHKGGIFDDKTVNEMLENISLIRNEQEWQTKPPSGS